MYDEDDEDQHTPQTIEAPKAKGAPVVVNVVEGEDNVLNFTQRKRQQIVKSLMGEDGENLQNLEKGDKMVVLAALDGMDRAALGRKRLKSDEKIGASQAMAAAIIAQVLQSPGALTAGQIPGHTRVIPQLTETIPDPATVPGETDADAAQMNYDTFMAQATASSPGQ